LDALDDLTAAGKSQASRRLLAGGDEAGSSRSGIAFTEIRRTGRLSKNTSLANTKDVTIGVA